MPLCTRLRSHIPHFNSGRLPVFQRSKKCAYAHLMVTAILRRRRVAADIKDQRRASRSPARPNTENYTKFAVRNADQTLRAVFAGLQGLQTRRVIDVQTGYAILSTRTVVLTSGVSGSSLTLNSYVAADIKDQCRISRSPSRPDGKNYTKKSARSVRHTSIP